VPSTPPDARPAEDPQGHVPAATLARGSWTEYNRIQRILSREATGGIILIVATVLALVLANSPAAGAYFGLRDLHLGGTVLGLDLDLSVGHWASDGLLAIFFFLAGLELKKEFVSGDLRDPGRALVPVTAAFGGVVVPALIFTAVVASSGGEGLRGWAIPTATDIAFALAVLAVIGSHLPAALRTFLLTLAIVDDLIAIVIIALFYTEELRLGMLGLALIPIVLFALAARFLDLRFKRSPWLTAVVLVPLFVVTWALFLESGIHATIAGVVLAFTVPVGTKVAQDPEGLSTVLEERVRPISAGFAVPVFAFFSVGVAVGGWSGLTSSWQHPVAIGIVLGLVLGKILGITGATFLVTRLRRANLDPSIRWIDLVGMAGVAGIGFTVSLLVTELSFAGSEILPVAKVGVLTASVLAAIIGSTILTARNKHYRQVALEESVDADHDEIPDLFEDAEHDLQHRRDAGH
jgi:Na+:H+ antiporter, NhaA family